MIFYFQKQRVTLPPLLEPYEMLYVIAHMCEGFFMKMTIDQVYYFSSLVCLIKRRTAKVSYFSIFLKLVMLSQSHRNPVDQLKTPLNPAGFRLTLAPNVSRPIIPSHQAITLRSSLLEGTRWAGYVQAPRRWITRTAPHRWIVGRSMRGDPIGCARLLAHH